MGVSLQVTLLRPDNSHTFTWKWILQPQLSFEVTAALVDSLTATSWETVTQSHLPELHLNLVR